MTKAQVALALLLLAPCSLLHAQRGAAPVTPPPSPRAAAPIDLIGYWESFITEDWRWRMMTPRAGDYASVALTMNNRARTVADAWDPAADEAAGEQCRAYGAAAVMRMPGRIRISWENDSTLRVETEAGTQTRLFHFSPPRTAAGPPTWQGHAVAQWQRPQVLPNSGTGRGGRAPAGTTLKTVSTRLRPGYLRKNGVPYSADAVVTEYYNVLTEANGDVWLIVNTMVEDPEFLTQPFVTSSQFKKLPDGSAWKPEPCAAR